MGAFRFVGYAIVSADGMIAAADGIMPANLKFEGDQRFLSDGLDQCDLVVHGRHSHEDQPQSPQRRRLILTRSVTKPTPHPAIPNATLWNPAETPFEDASAFAGVRNGTIAAIGGTSVFDMFLDRYDVFWLSLAPRVRLPVGVPVFSGVPAQTPEEILAAHGLEPSDRRMLDAAHDVTVVEWKRG